MQTYNHLFSSKKRFETFVESHNIAKDENHFVQVFIGSNDSKQLQETLQIISEYLPNASTIASSTAGEIIEGGMSEESTVVSVSTFNATDVSVKLLKHGTSEEMVDELLRSAITPKTKLIIVFNNVYENDGEEFIELLQTKTPKLIIAGGNAGDNGKFSMQTLVGVNQEVSTTGVALAIFDSEVLQVFHDLLFNWQTIGEPMQVTKADKNIIYEINHQKTEAIYRHFLGEEVANSLPLSAVEFPLIFEENGFDIARAPVAIGEHGELIMAGHITEGETVRFGFCDIVQNDINVIKSVQDFATNPIESIFIYSCSARKYFLKGHINAEFEMLQKIAPTSGFITYGEFFSHKEHSKLLNVSSTFIGLSENSEISHTLDLNLQEMTPTTKTLHALTHLVKQTSKSIEKNNIQLKQFEELIKKATLYSKTNLKGIITDVNQNFIELSGYSREELIGKNHNIVRHNDVSSKVYQEMWQTIQNKKSWQGIIKNRTKDGSNYYVRSHVFPILDIKGEIVEYVSLRDDVTEEIRRREYLQGSLDTLEEESSEKAYLIKQYEKIINLSSSFFRINHDFNLLYVNDIFCDIYKCEKEKLLTRNLLHILEPDFIKSDFTFIHKKLLKDGTWSGVVPFQRKDGTIVHMNTSASTIYNRAGDLIEIMLVMNDISDLITIQKEIEDTQRDVVYTMGAIGETRSRETGNHVKRVAEYSKLLALKYGLTQEKAELLKMASPMHDIGKVGIPDAILNKPGKLTDDEWKIMKTHSTLGYTMLKNSKREILKTAAIVAYTHHEQWNGGGYPKGLKGEDIHIYGRITAIADVFDALGSDRCYKKAWDDEKIFKLLKEGKGTHFDPKLVDLFFENLDSFLSIRENFKDEIK